MYRLISVAFLLLMLAACGRTAERAPKLEGATLQRETAGLGGVSPVSIEMADKLTRRRFAPVDELPPLPLHVEKQIAEVEDFTLAGAQSHSFGGGAVDDGTAKRLMAGATGISWVVYQFSGFNAADDLQRIILNTSDPQFGGANPGYWIGIANFEDKHWKTLARAEVQQFSIGVQLTQPYLSPLGNVYLFVLVADQQAVSIEDITLRYDNAPDSPWTEVVLEEGNQGWSASVALDWYGSPWIAHVDRSTFSPRYAWGLANEDLTVATNWTRDYIMKSETGAPRTDLKADFTDICIDTRVQLPLASFNYVDFGGGDALDSQIGMSAFVIDAQADPSWFYFFFGNGGAHGPTTDGAGYSSIHFDPFSEYFGLVTTTSNEDSPTLPPEDLAVRYAHIMRTGGGVFVDDVDLYTGFRPEGGLLFPHLRFNPNEERTRILVNGNEFLANIFPSPDWDIEQDEINTEPFGSLAYNEAGGETLYGATFAKNLGIERVLFYSAYGSEGAAGEAEQVDAIGISDGAWIGGCSQLAYTHMGVPVILYTVNLVSGVELRYATKVGDAWVVETVSTGVAPASADPQDVLCDIAAEPVEFSIDVARTGKLWAVWNHISGAESLLKAAQRQEPTP